MVRSHSEAGGGLTAFYARGGEYARSQEFPTGAKRGSQSPLATRRHFFYASSVWSKPRQLDSESALYEAAIKILMRRAHSVHEMKKALARRCEDEKLIKAVLSRLKEHNYLDDARYAKQFTRVRTESRKQGAFRIARDLRARGIPDQHIEKALKDSAEDNDPSAMVRQRIERKLRLSRGELTDKKIASLYRSLLAAGFPSDIIRKELFRITHEEVPDAGSEADPESE
jgi:regulatory protein